MAFDRNHARRRTLQVILPGALLAVAITAAPAGAQSANTNLQFATGAVTSVHGTSIQVSNQTQNSESTVVVSPSTQISKRQSADASAITVGACVRVLGTGSTAKGISAQSVALSTSSSGGCTAGPRRGANGPGGFRFGNGRRPRNFGDGNAAAGGFRNGNGNRTRPANFAAAAGPVVSISGDKLVVKSTTFVRPESSTAKGKSAKSKQAKAKAKAKVKTTAAPKTTTSDVTVTLASSTAITETVAGTAADVTVGSCVAATGTPAGGGVSADRMTVSAPVNGSCTGGFGFGGRGGGGAGGPV